MPRDHGPTLPGLLGAVLALLLMMASACWGVWAVMTAMAYEDTAGISPIRGH